MDQNRPKINKHLMLLTKNYISVFLHYFYYYRTKRYYERDKKFPKLYQHLEQIKCLQFNQKKWNPTKLCTAVSIANASLSGQQMKYN